MKTVPLHQFKLQLSALVKEAAGGETILVTKHKQPLVCLVSSELLNTHLGEKCGEARLTPALQRATKGTYLAVLLEDRAAEGAGGTDR